VILEIGMSEFAKIFAMTFKEYGPAVTIVVSLILMNGFFIWRDFKRETHQQAQLEQLHQLHNQTVVPLLVSCREAIKSAELVIIQNNQIILRLVGRDS
jgi:hypothetical protein